MRDLVGFHKPIGMRHKLGLSRSASILCQQAREIVCQRGQGVPERGGRKRRGGAAWRRMGREGEWATRRMGDSALNILFPPIVPLFPRPSGITSSWITDVFY
jgi:hypothetical protein